MENTKAEFLLCEVARTVEEAVSRSGHLCFKTRNLQLEGGKTMLHVSAGGHCIQIQNLGAV